MNLTPPADRVLIRQCEPETETGFGLAIPESAQEKPMRGVVVAVGEGEWDRNGMQRELGLHLSLAEDFDDNGAFIGDAWYVVPLEVGDEVVLPRVGGTSLEYDGIEYVSILASELLAVVTA